MVEPTASGLHHWAAIILILRQGAATGSGWPEIRGWPEQQFYGETESAAFHLADGAAKAWIDVQDDARWSGVVTDSGATG